MTQCVELVLGGKFQEVAPAPPLSRFGETDTPALGPHLPIVARLP